MKVSPAHSRRHVVATVCVLVLVEVLFGAAFCWQLSRALGGNALSWAYVVEWPILGLYGIWFAYSDLTGRDRTLRRRGAPAAARDAADAASLAAYNAYLANLGREGTHELAGEDSNP